MTDYQEKLNEARANNRNLFGALGETGKGFNAMHDAAVKDGALDLKTKELEGGDCDCDCHALRGMYRSTCQGVPESWRYQR